MITNVGAAVGRVAWLGNDKLAWAGQVSYWEGGKPANRDKPAGAVLDRATGRLLWRFKANVIERYVTLTCVSNDVGGDLVGTARWQGVRLTDLLASVGVTADADLVVGESVDGFTTGFPLSVLDDGREAERAARRDGGHRVGSAAELAGDHGGVLAGHQRRYGGHRRLSGATCARGRRCGRTPRSRPGPARCGCWPRLPAPCPAGP